MFSLKSQAHTEYNQEIQVLRAIAVLIVVVHHLSGLFVWDVQRWSSFGEGLYVGVDLFFCVSGYVIAKALIPCIAGKTGIGFWREVSAFWLKRLYRITPSAWVWLVFPMSLSPLMTHVPIGIGAGNFADAASAVLHVANFHFFKCTQGNTACGSFAGYWTLSLEEQFYLLLPLAVLFFRNRLVSALIFLLVLQLFIPRPHWEGLLSFIRTDAIIFGVLLAIFSNNPIYKVLEPRLDKSRFGMVLPILLIFCLIAVTRYQIVSFYTGLSAIVCALIVWICSYDKGYFFKPSFFRKILVWVGTRSYAIYLIHIPSLWFTREIWAKIEPEGTVFGAHYTLRFAMTFILLLVFLSEINFRFIEEPLRIKGKQHASRLTRPEETV